MAKNENKASVLAFEKKLVASDGYLFGTVWNERENVVPLRLKEKSVRGTISNRLKPAIKNDTVKLNAEVEKPNLQTVDSCALGQDQDTLKLQFTLKVLGGLERPSACNNDTFRSNYKKVVRDYIEKEGFKELSMRYATNIANGRYLWRNRIGSEKVEVQVQTLNTDSPQTWVFDATKISTKDFTNSDENINSLAKRISDVLSSDNDSLILEIDCFAKIGKAQEVYPSEELVMDKGNAKSKKSKILYSVDDIAALHSQKIGNAIRTIDTWYPAFSDAEESVGPIAIEPYGAVTNLGKAYRTPKDKQDFYTLFDKYGWGNALDRVEDEHYVMAVLVRGGVFGEGDE